MKKILAATLALTMVFALSACSGKTDTTKSSTVQPKRDTITVAIPAAPANLDGNLHLTTSDYFTSGNVFEKLIGFNSDGSYRFQAAEKISRSDDGLTAFIKIREGMKFQDGTPVTIDDVIFSYNRAMNEGKQGGGLAGVCIPELVKVDETTCSIKLLFPAVDVNALLVYGGIVPKAAVEKDPAAFDKAPIGSGPYKIVSYTNNETIKLEAFNDYYDTKANIKNIICKVISDPSAAAIALEAGEVDVVYSVSNLDVKNLEGNDKFTVARNSAAHTQMVQFLKGPNMENPKLREGLYHAINPKDALIAGVDGDGTEAKNGIFLRLLCRTITVL